MANRKPATAAQKPKTAPEASFAWTPQPGSQTLFLTCPAFECLYHGTRGPGKTDALLMDFAQHVGQGYGAAWRGVLLRRQYPDLAEVIAKSNKWFGRVGNGARYNKARSTWIWPTGEELLFRQFKNPDDYRLEVTCPAN